MAGIFVLHARVVYRSFHKFRIRSQLYLFQTINSSPDNGSKMSYDPYAAKMASVSAVPINSQPMPSHYAPLQGTVAMPSALYVSPAAQAHHVPQQPPLQGSHTVRPPEGRWRDSICDWGNNLFPSCYCACCFFYGMYLVAQSKPAA